MEPEQTPVRLPRIRDDVAIVEIDGEAVLYEPRRIMLYHLNVTAAIIYQVCDGTGTVQQLAVDIAESFGVPLEQVEPEVHAIVHMFDEIGILEGSPLKEEEASVG